MDAEGEEKEGRERYVLLGESLFLPGFSKLFKFWWTILESYICNMRFVSVKISNVVGLFFTPYFSPVPQFCSRQLRERYIYIYIQKTQFVAVT